MGYYLYCEDLAGALIGPFATVELAHEHQKLIIARGDADLGHLYREDDIWVAHHFKDNPCILHLTPEQDLQEADEPIIVS